MVRLTENIATDGAIEINCVAPGFVATRMHDGTLAAGPDAVGSAYYARTQEQIEAGGFPAAEAAELVAFLLRTGCGRDHRPADQRAVGSVARARLPRPAAPRPGPRQAQAHRRAVLRPRSLNADRVRLAHGCPPPNTPLGTSRPSLNSPAPSIPTTLTRWLAG